MWMMMMTVLMKLRGDDVGDGVYEHNAAEDGDEI